MHFKPRIELMLVLVIAWILSFATTILIHNTLQDPNISDSLRYQDSLKKNIESRFGVYIFSMLRNDSPYEFLTKTNLFIFFIIGTMVYYSTKDWTITLLALLGFSVSLLTYFSLLAQAIVIMCGLFLWFAIPTKGIKNHLLFLAIGFFMLLTHKYGLILCLAIYGIKSIESRTSKELQDKLLLYIKPLSCILYLILGIFLFLAFSSSSEHVEFFYPFLIPVSLGAFDILFWYLLLGTILALLQLTKTSFKEVGIACIVFGGIIINYLAVTQLQIDVWRLFGFFEIVSLVAIARERQENTWLFWIPIILLLIGIERLVVGII